MINLLSSFSPASDVTVIVKVVGFSDSTVQRKKVRVRESPQINYSFTSVKLNFLKTYKESKLLIHC